MKIEKLMPTSLFFYILIPMASAGIVISMAAIAILTPALSRNIESRIESDLDLAVALGIEICEERFIGLLDLRLSDDLRMREAIRRETVNQVEELSGRFRHIDMAIVSSEGVVESSTYPPISVGTLLDVVDFDASEVIRQNIDGRDYILRTEYFPFWRWHVVSLISVEEALEPVALMRRTIFFSLIAILMALVIVLLINLQVAVKSPLTRIIQATEEIAKGRFPRIHSSRKDEIGKVTHAINRMSESLRRHSENADHALHRLKESERRFRRIVESSQAGYFLLDTDRRIVDVNEAWLRIFKYGSRDEIAGKEIAEIFAPEEASSIEEFWTRLELGIPIPSGELKRINRDATIGFSTFSVNPLYREDRLIGFEGFLIDTTEQKMYQEALERSLAEKSVLLQEIHHRVKNNLNIVVSLLNLQNERITSIGDAREALQVSCNRIYSMALVHEKLYQSENIAYIDLESYVRAIMNELLSVYNDTVAVDVDLQLNDIELDITRAIPCGLILNELITNSLIHAFKNRQHGCITVSFRSVDDTRWELVYTDDGVGFAGSGSGYGGGKGRENDNNSYSDIGFVPDDQSSLGLKLIQILSEQLGGEAKFESDGGFRFSLLIQKEEP
ncbi:MAG: histidine kinase dimerization/phosphoacceptor domain -containing protein [Spirochaetota bacterium]|nr:histidine kinase dimerization/phosphoacceptor domain -containing protein [Spirochaetota bacterium]